MNVYKIKTTHGTWGERTSVIAESFSHAIQKFCEAKSKNERDIDAIELIALKGAAGKDLIS